MADELVAKLLAKPDIPGVCTELLRNKDEFIADTDISAILVQLSPQNHSNAYVALLLIQYEAAAGSGSEWLGAVSNLFQVAQVEKLQLIANHVHSLARLFLEVNHQKEQVETAVQPLKNLCLRMSPSRDTLTALHQPFYFACILSKCYSTAYPLLLSPAYLLEPKGLVPQTLLETLYYSGIICMAVKDLPRAASYFRMTVSSPAESTSTVAVEAYKKLILVSLIRDGKSTKLPSIIRSGVTRSLASACAEYIKFAEAYVSLEDAAVATSIESLKHTFESDGNLGLVLQCQASLPKHRIKRLTKTFLTLSLADIVARAKLESADHALTLLEEMAVQGQIQARIDQAKGVVSFVEEQSDEAAALAALDDLFEQAMELHNTVGTLDEQIQLSKVYIAKSLETSEHKQVVDPMDMDDGDAFLA